MKQSIRTLLIPAVLLLCIGIGFLLWSRSTSEGFENGASPGSIPGPSSSQCIAGPWENIGFCQADTAKCGAKAGKQKQSRSLTPKVLGASCEQTDIPIAQFVPCDLRPCEIPKPDGTVAVNGTPAKCGNTYTIKMYQSAIDPKGSIVYYSNLVAQQGKEVVPVKTSWRVTNQEGFQPVQNSYTPGDGNFEIATFTFDTPGVYEIEYKVEVGKESCTLNMSTTVLQPGRLNCVPFKQVPDISTNRCLNVVLPTAPPDTVNGPDYVDLVCPPGVKENCDIYYTLPSGVKQKQWPCVKGKQVYDFALHQCVKKQDKCCRYETPGAAMNDPDCRSRLRQIQKLNTDGVKFCEKYPKHECCAAGNSLKRNCLAYWTTPEIVWANGPPDCGGEEAFEDMDGGYEDDQEEKAGVDDDTELYPEGAFTEKRQQFFDLKGMFE